MEDNTSKLRTGEVVEVGGHGNLEVSREYGKPPWWSYIWVRSQCVL